MTYGVTRRSRFEWRDVVWLRYNDSEELKLVEQSARLEDDLAYLGIMDWKRTSSQFVAILQSLDRFEANTIREIAKKNGETILAGTLRGSDETDWYAIAYDRNEYEFDEARIRAKEALERYRDSHRVAY